MSLNNEKTAETLTKQLESLNDTDLHQVFVFYYRLNHNICNLTIPQKFEEFLRSFEKNPFKLQEDKTFRKQLIESLVKYTTDHMSLISAIMLIKNKFTIDEIIDNYYSSIHAFDNDLF